MPEGSSAYKSYGGFVQPLGLNLWLLCKKMLCQVPSNIWRLSNIRGLQATFFIWGKMLCCKKLLKKLHILAETVRKRPFQREIGCICGISSVGNAKRMISALFFHGGWVFRGERCKKLSLDDFLFVWESNHMLTALTDEQRWNGNEFFALCEKVFAWCEEFFCTVWRGFLHCVKRFLCTGWRVFFALCEEALLLLFGVLIKWCFQPFQNNLQYPINIITDYWKLDYLICMHSISKHWVIL